MFGRNGTSSINEQRNKCYPIQGLEEPTDEVEAYTLQKTRLVQIISHEPVIREGKSYGTLHL